MIMKKFYTIFAIAALMLAACAEPEPEQPVVPTPTPDEEAEQTPAVYFTYGGAADETRTAMGTPKEDGTSRFVWVEGDKVGVSCKELEKYNHMVTVPANTNGGEYYNTSFNTHLLFKDATTKHTFYLYYPYNTNSSATSTIVEGSIPSNQNGDLSKSDFMWDIVTTTAANPRVSGQMIHPHAYLRFYIVDASTKNNNGAATTIAGMKVNAISIVGEGALTGTFKADLGSFDRKNPYNNVLQFTSTQSNAATLTYPADAAYNTVLNKTAWESRKVEKNHPVMVVNPAGINGKNFKIDVAIEGLPVFEVALSGKKIESGKFYNISLGGLKQTDGSLKLTVIGWTEIQGSVEFE
jgi:hypothetical protein